MEDGELDSIVAASDDINLLARWKIQLNFHCKLSSSADLTTVRRSRILNHIPM